MKDLTSAYVFKLMQTGKFDEVDQALGEMFENPAKREKAWAWLYACAKTDKQKAYSLKKILELNPSHLEARLRLRDLGEQVEELKSDLIPGRRENFDNLEARIEISTQPSNSLMVDTETSFQGPESAENLVDAEAAQDSDAVELKDENKRKIPYKPPKVISRRPDDDAYAKREYSLSDFPDIESGMYGSKLLSGGIFITPGEHPECFDTDDVIRKSQCRVCEFFAERDCPIRKDPNILGEARVIFSINKQHWQELRERRDSVIDAIYTELIDHGRPLHYEVVFKIIRNRYPKLKLTSWAVLRIMASHPEKFESTDRGVYKAK